MKALDVLERAVSLIHGQRAKDYGDAQASFQRMADLVNPIIKKADGKLTASDMAIVMIQVKIARLQERKKIMLIHGLTLQATQRSARNWPSQSPTRPLQGQLCLMVYRL